MNKIIQGNCLEVLAGMDPGSVDCVVTSPPYWSQRDYQAEGQIGLEESPDKFVEALIDIFDQVKRVLKPLGACWVVLGDTYGGSWQGKRNNSTYERNCIVKAPPSYNFTKKCMCCIPERFVLRMLERGWIKRNTIIWHKTRPRRCYVKDRVENVHDYVFFFTRESHNYFFGDFKYDRVFHDSVWTLNLSNTVGHCATFPEKLAGKCIELGCPPGGIVLDPFMGSGTVAVAAMKLGRKFTGIEINPEWVELARARVDQSKDMLTELQNGEGMK